MRHDLPDAPPCGLFLVIGFSARDTSQGCRHRLGPTAESFQKVGNLAHRIVSSVVVGTAHEIPAALAKQFALARRQLYAANGTEEHRFFRLSIFRRVILGLGIARGSGLGHYCVCTIMYD